MWSFKPDPTGATKSASARYPSAPPNERGALLETGLLDATAPQRHDTTR